MSDMLTYEDKIKRIQEVCELLSNEETTLDEAMILFKEAQMLISECRKELSDASDKVHAIISGIPEE